MSAATDEIKQAMARLKGARTALGHAQHGRPCCEPELAAALKRDRQAVDALLAQVGETRALANRLDDERRRWGMQRKAGT